MSSFEQVYQTPLGGSGLPNSTPAGTREQLQDRQGRRLPQNFINSGPGGNFTIPTTLPPVNNPLLIPAATQNPVGGGGYPNQNLGYPQAQSLASSLGGTVSQSSFIDPGFAPGTPMSGQQSQINFGAGKDPLNAGLLQDLINKYGKDSPLVKQQLAYGGAPGMGTPQSYNPVPAGTAPGTPVTSAGKPLGPSPTQQAFPQQAWQNLGFPAQQFPQARTQPDPMDIFRRFLGGQRLPQRPQTSYEIVKDGAGFTSWAPRQTASSFDPWSMLGGDSFSSPFFQQQQQINPLLLLMSLGGLFNNYPPAGFGSQLSLGGGY